MSLAVLTIAAAHALFPLVGMKIGGRKGIWIGAGIGVFVAFVTGAIIFTIFDLLGVGAGVMLSLNILDKK